VSSNKQVSLSPQHAQPTPATGDSYAIMNACWADALAGGGGRAWVFGCL
jgi:hypothetical protein